MDRREVLGSLWAIFCGIAVPAVVCEVIRVRPMLVRAESVTGWRFPYSTCWHTWTSERFPL